MSTVDDGRMPLVEHLRELRNRLAKGLLAVTVGIVASFFFWEPILDLLSAPYTPYCESVGDEQCKLFAFGPLEQFAIRLKVSSMAGILASSPVWLYQLGPSSRRRCTARRSATRPGSWSPRCSSSSPATWWPT